MSYRCPIMYVLAAELPKNMPYPMWYCDTVTHLTEGKSEDKEYLFVSDYVNIKQ